MQWGVINKVIFGVEIGDDLLHSCYMVIIIKINFPCRNTYGTVITNWTPVEKIALCNQPVLNKKSA